ncbi:gamma-glutamyltransferase [Jiella mangrovi]|uniref:Glutathione hydrolase proenzyme n=1 Tax=Jiella mangrovi TaxID=2821407 RepID=A0ABS4BCJ4_9HYPH|nr:gamma-glutamyltransferase [Jiella mangrovi]MBP0614484.1 gamma-glutamyltransferase [Jiella mangrovi]
MTSLRPVLAAAIAGLLLAIPCRAQQAADAVEPEAPTGMRPVSTEPAKATKFMVAAANQLAAEAGLQILKKGGNAIDAMVTTQLVLNLVEPQSSGIGGGAFLVYFDAKAGRLTTFDGRETAPAAADPTLFLDEAGDPLSFYDAVVGGRSVGTPGTLRLIFDTHERFGALDWKTVVQPAIDLATDGFKVSPRLHALIVEEGQRLKRFAGARDYFFDAKGEPLKVGAILKNEAFAKTLRLIADKGAAGFYEGPIAEDIVRTVQNAEGNPGRLALSDLKNYRIVEREPVCLTYRAYEVCGMGPPSSGALTVGQILGLIEPFDIAALGPGSAKAWRLIGDASRLAFADRGRYMADIDYVPMPLRGLLDKDYLATRSKLLMGDTALAKDAVAPGTPPWDHAMLRGDDVAIELPSTSHFSIVDGTGNVVSITTTIENGFGSRLMTGGFLLNNELTDFSFETHDADGAVIANAVAPGKRPRSSMAPTVVMQDGKPVLAIGSPGGSRIIGYVAEALIAVLDWNMNVQEAASLPHLVNRFGTYDVEAGTDAAKLAGPLSDLGFEVKEADLNSGIHAIAITPEGLEGGADPRREGVALGE